MRFVVQDAHATTSTPAPATAPRTPARSADTKVTASPVSWESDAEIHLIRLCLDLQLDAMLLAVGASAAQSPATQPLSSTPTEEAATASAGHPDTEATDIDSPPWDRWVREDVEVACTLAADVLSGGATLPAALGSDLDQAVPAAAIDNLIARYESMSALLADVLPAGDCRPPTAYRRHAQEALDRFRQRLHELRSTRLEKTPPRGLNLTALTDRPAVPGEWLG
jgi:hypothetical protein